MPIVHFFRYPESVIDDRQSHCTAQILWRIPGMGLSLFDPQATSAHRIGLPIAAFCVGQK